MQISEDKMIQIWGDTRFNSNVWVLCHALNEEKCIGRLIKSVLPLKPYKIVILIDDRTTDKTKEIAESLGAETEYFKWCHNYSYPKNILTKKVPKGDWCLIMGGDFEMQPHTISEIQEFVKDPLNVAAKFQIPEYSPDDRPVVTRPRTLLWRSHPLLYWQRLVHEEMHFSLYRMLAIGIPFTPEKNLPLLGGTNGMLHFADHEDSDKEKWQKRCYYLVLYELDKIINRSNLPEDYVKNFDVEKMVDDYTKNGFPEGLEELYEKAKVVGSELEEESIR